MERPVSGEIPGIFSGASRAPVAKPAAGRGTWWDRASVLSPATDGGGFLFLLSMNLVFNFVMRITDQFSKTG